MRNTYLILGILFLVMLWAVWYGFGITGSPFKRQALKVDQARLSDLSNISYSINNYFNKNQKLPETITEAVGSDTYAKKVDPETGKEYEYQKATDTTYKLCATFSTDSTDSIKSAGEFGVVTAQNLHKKGYYCISYEIPEYYIKKTQTYVAPSLPQVPKEKIKLSYDGDVLSWTSVAGYRSVTLVYKDAKGASLLEKAISIDTADRPYFYNKTWKTAYIKAAGATESGDYGYVIVSNVVTNTSSQ